MGKPLLRWLDPIINPLACLPPPPESSRIAKEQVDSLLKRLEATLRQKLRYALVGEKRSIIRGQGLDFAELREYMPGDDIRKIDWNVFARTLSPHVREYHEEKQLTVWLAIDCTPSMHFGHQKTKLEQAIELAGLLALMAERSHHRLGAFLIRGDGTEIIPPRSGQAQTRQIMNTLLDTARNPNPIHCGQDPLPDACAKLGHVVQKHTSIFFLSDFLSLSERWDIPLGQLSRHAQLVHLVLQDPVEQALPEGLGLLPVMDPETGQYIQIDTHDRDFREAYATHARGLMALRLQRLKETGTVVEAGTGEDPAQILLTLLKTRQGRTARRPA
ncbi:MAG TPA: DUF58 domain-containing protein [Coleofasciculaceae cyanobacterium]|jgi:uncharacterized protein (DUF58 family)